MDRGGGGAPLSDAAELLSACGEGKVRMVARTPTLAQTLARTLARTLAPTLTPTLTLTLVLALALTLTLAVTRALARTRTVVKVRVVAEAIEAPQPLRETLRARAEGFLAAGP